MKLDFTGKTALVTGASAGIGREIARVLARDVATMVLVARRRDRLQALADELTRLRQGQPLAVVVSAVDLTDRAETARFLDALGSTAVDILINNAGFGDRGLFEGAEWGKLERMLDLNVVAATHLLRRLVPPMVSRGFGAVLNVGSTAGLLALPDSAVYAASKAYLNHLSDALRAELAGTGVVVTTLLPGPVETEFQGVAGLSARPRTPGPFWVDAERCAEEAVRALKQGRARVVPGTAVWAAAHVVEATPTGIIRQVLARAGRKIRKRRQS